MNSRAMKIAAGYLLIVCGLLLWAGWESQFGYYVAFALVISGGVLVRQANESWRQIFGTNEHRRNTESGVQNETKEERQRRLHASIGGLIFVSNVTFILIGSRPSMNILQEHAFAAFLLVMLLAVISAVLVYPYFVDLFK